MQRLKRILFSTRTMTILLLVYGISMMVATFIESSFDTATAKTLIYNAKWFEVLMLWLTLLFIANIKTYRLTRREKWPILIFHLAFIFMFIGGAITRYTSFEGQMPIKENQITNEIISDLTYFKLSISDGSKTLNYNKHPYVMSHFNSKDTKWPLRRTFKQRFLFKDKVVTLKSLDYIPLAKDSVRMTEFGEKMLNIVSIGQSGRVNNYISNGETKSIDGVVFSFNNPIKGSVQLKEENNRVFINLPTDGQYISMLGQQKGVVTDSTLLTQQSGIIKANVPTILDHRALYAAGNSNFIVPKTVFKANKVYYKGDKNNPMDKTLLDAIVLEVTSEDEKDTLIIKGGKGVTNFDKTIRINGLNVSLGFGSKIIRTDFYLRCDDFILERYPGSNNPSSYESKVTIIDGSNEAQHHIYMNNVVDYKGYRFFQASYFPDESGTILSVNADRWGTNVTYFGYFLLFIGMFFTLFWKGTRFWKLNNSLKKLNAKPFLLFSILFTIAVNSCFSQNSKTIANDTTLLWQKPKPTAQFAKPDELGKNRIIDARHAEKFGQLLVQDYAGRIKPMNTQTLELLRKVYKKDTYDKDDLSLSSEQWFISMQIDPGYWANESLIKVSKKGGDKLLKEAKANNSGYTSYSNLVDINTGNYKLERQNNRSFSKRKADQSNYDKAVIELTERFNIFSNVAFGYYTKVIPVKHDTSQTWRSWIYTSNISLVEVDSIAYRLLTNYFNAVKEGLKTGNWKTANLVIEDLSEFQQAWGKDIVPSKTKITLEILYNRLNIFFWLMVVYSILGVLLIAFGFIDVLLFTGKKISRLVNISIKVLLGVMTLAVIVQVWALGIRWYVSGHAPWSNGYEAIIFISGIGVFSGLLLYKNRNAFIPAAGALVAMIMMGFSHGGSMLDPQITPLEPVLKSYWLMVHVGIITSSYGFFGLSAILSMITLILFSITPSKKILHSIKELTIVNEMALTIGIFTLTIGTFLGGMWANESWGRYWSWDPKETWAFISVILYAVVLHLRLVPKLKSKLIFNIASLWAIWSIIFTYFGVNYYLTGLHSYAAGDPIPIPMWIYITVVGMIILSLVAYLRNKIVVNNEL